MIKYVIDGLFIISLVLIPFIPRKGKIKYIWMCILILNIGIRIFLIYDSHIKSNKINDLEKRARIEESKIRSFDSKLELTLVGKWESERRPDKLKMLSPVDNQCYIVLRKNAEAVDSEIKFYATKSYVYKEAGKNRVFFEARQAVRSGSFPLGSDISELDTYKYISIWIPRVRQKHLLDKKLLIEKAKIDFFINGTLIHTRIYNKTTTIGLFDNDWAGFALIGNNITSTRTKVN